ncbi:tether containing UBX domain for GLUT4 isoform X1 [Anopheles darlingi]|uniref:tether containing UBX domain for GLUT4 isoform X1 n=1 Tax=Anopheles darlingi TaxID=43151 RepID=UPI0021001792|nr:tether containing UBX domain for GLUT4 isoform X1 [Anopheles darlingi]
MNANQQQQKFIIVRAMNNRQYTVPVAPNMTFYDILKNVCQKTNLEPAEHVLSFRTRLQDSSLMFRFSGIPNKAMLDMEKAKQARILSPVTILLHCENGARPSGTFAATASLLEVLQQLSPELARADANPVMIYTRCELFFEQLAGTTLENLGLTSGRAVVRLLQRKPEQLKTQANVSSPLPKVIRDEEPAAPKKETQATETASKLPEHPPACADSVPQTKKVPLPTVEQTESVAPPSLAATTDSNADSLSVAPPSSVATTDSAETNNQDIPSAVPTKDVSLAAEGRAGIIVYIGDRQAVLYHRELYEQEPSYYEEDDSFFDLSIREVTRLQIQLHERVLELEAMPLVAATWLEIQRKRTMLGLISRYPQSVIRILFPDQYILQGVFEADETVADIENFVRGFLVDPTTPFTLYTTPPKEILQSTATLYESNCLPRAMLHFGSSASPADGCSYLESKLMEQLSDVYGAAEVAGQVLRHKLHKGGAGHKVKSVPVNAATPAPTGQLHQYHELHQYHDQIAGPSQPKGNTNSANTQSQQQHSKQEAMLLKFLKK